jgi:hypothetical protein
LTVCLLPTQLLWRHVGQGASNLLRFGQGCGQCAIALRLDQTRQTEIKNLQPPIGCQAQIPGFKSRWITPRSWAAANP